MFMSWDHQTCGRMVYQSEYRLMPVWANQEQSEHGKLRANEEQSEHRKTESQSGAVLTQETAGQSGAVLTQRGKGIVIVLPRGCGTMPKTSSAWRRLSSSSCVGLTWRVNTLMMSSPDMQLCRAYLKSQHLDDVITDPYLKGQHLDDVITAHAALPWGFYST